MTSIKRNVESIQSAIKSLKERIDLLHGSCKHTRISFEYCGNHDDTYRVEFTCNDCGLSNAVYKRGNPVDYKFQGSLGSVWKIPKSEMEVFTKVYNIVQTEVSNDSLYEVVLNCIDPDDLLLGYQIFLVRPGSTIMDKKKILFASHSDNWGYPEGFIDVIYSHQLAAAHLLCEELNRGLDEI